MTSASLAPLMFANPFRPGAGHLPPHLAGRKEEEAEFRRLLGQDVVMENMILTGLRGVGKTVLLERFKSIAFRENWMWVGTDLSESASISETTLAQRILADIAPTTSTIAIGPKKQLSFGFSREERKQWMLEHPPHKHEIKLPSAVVHPASAERAEQLMTMLRTR